MKKIFYSPPHLSGSELELIQDALATNFIAPYGPYIDKFENILANYIGSSCTLATNSGTSAIHLALRLLNIGHGDIVFCSSLTWIASIAPAIYLGAEPVFIDSEEETWNMSPKALENALNDAAANNQLPKAVIVVHLFGQSAKMAPILHLCEKFNIPVIEDAAQSLGATYTGKHCGTLGCFGIYSFNGNKIITTSSGGALISNDIEAINRARYLSGHARLPVHHHEHSEIGYNYRMSNICAAIGVAQLQVLDKRISARRSVYAEYHRRLTDLHEIIFRQELPDSYSTHWMTVIILDKKLRHVTKDKLFNSLYCSNIEARHVWMPQHLQPVMKKYKFYPHSEYEDVSARLFKTGLCLPSGSNLSSDDMERIIDRIYHCFEKNSSRNKRLSRTIPR